MKTLCRHNKIPLKHHRAGNDSEATAKLSLKVFEKAKVESIEDFPTKLRTTVGRLFNGGYKPSETKRLDKPKLIKELVDNRYHRQRSEPSLQDHFQHPIQPDNR